MMRSMLSRIWEYVPCRTSVVILLGLAIACILEKRSEVPEYAMTVFAKTMAMVNSDSLYIVNLV
jgi:hypothetical protein